MNEGTRMNSKLHKDDSYTEILQKFTSAIENLQSIKRKCYGETERTDTIEDTFIGLLNEMMALIIEVRDLRLFAESKGNAV